VARLSLLLAVLVVCMGCGAQRSAADPGQVDATTAPQVGACRNLTAADIEATTNATALTDCADPHNAETYAAGALPARFAGASYDDGAVADWAYTACTGQLERHLGADESLVMRSILSWVWFRPSPSAWDEGARLRRPSHLHRRAAARPQHRRPVAGLRARRLRGRRPGAVLAAARLARRLDHQGRRAR
jgi:hypothetical protein